MQHIQPLMGDAAFQSVELLSLSGREFTVISRGGPRVELKVILMGNVSIWYLALFIPDSRIPVVLSW